MKGNVYEGRGKVTELEKKNLFPIRVSRIETLPPTKGEKSGSLGRIPVVLGAKGGTGWELVDLSLPGRDSRVESLSLRFLALCLLHLGGPTPVAA